MAGVSIIVAVLGIAFVIFIHELGHFLFAKWAGVKVERFSIGMGPIIWSRQIGETEYALSILPIGGYVKMLGQEELPGQAADSDDDRSFTNKHPAWRAAILFGGVLFNIVSSYIILLVLAWYGMPVVNPQVGAVQSSFIALDGTEQPTPAWQNNIRVGDRIIAVNGEKVRSFTDVLMSSIRASTEEMELTIVRDGIELPPIVLKSAYNLQAGRHTLGIVQPYGLRIAEVLHLASLTESGRASIDIQANDRVVGIKGIAEDFAELGLVGQQVYDRLNEYNGKDITLIIDRHGQRHEVSFRYCDVRELVESSLGAMVYIKLAQKDKPAYAAGLRSGDYVSAINGTTVLNSTHLRGLIRQATMQEQEIVITAYRANADNIYVAQNFTMHSTLDERTGRSIIGILPAAEVVGPMLYSREVPGSEKSPLAEAGLEMGDIIIDYTVKREDGEAAKLLTDLPSVSTAHVLRIRGGVLQHIPVDKTVYHGLRKQEKLGFFAKVFGMKPQPTAWSGMMVSRILQAPTQASPVLMVRHYENKANDDVGEVRQIDLNIFNEEQRASLYALQIGDWIINRNPYIPLSVDPALVIVRGSDQDQPQRIAVNLGHAGSGLNLMLEEHPYELESWTEAFSIANSMCKQIILGTINMIPRFFKKPEDGGIEASKSLSGPIGIFSGLKQKTEHFGFASFLKLLAVIGINLFLVNMLPIPIVDGGQLVFLGIEVIIRRPIPEVIINIAMWIGLIAIVSLMIFVIGLDIDREFLN